MKLNEAGKVKKAKKKSGDVTGAFKILFDLLLSLLTKQQSFLREMVNYVFKSFCTELDQDTLGQMIKIVSTPNE